MIAQMGEGNITDKLKKAEIRHDLGSPGINFPSYGRCFPLPTTVFSNDTLYVDLFTDYPIHLVILRGNVLSHTHAAVTVRLDKKNYKSILFSDESKLSHAPVLSGRVLSISTFDRISLCVVEIYTCKAGKTGLNCDQDCADGFYGLACKEKCSCPQSVPCDKTTGICPTGCMSASGGASEACYTPTVKVAHDDKISATKTTAISISQGPTTDLASSKVYEPTKQCITVSSRCYSKSLYLELALTKPISLYGVEITFTKFSIPAPFSMYITADGRPCYGLTSQSTSLQLKKHVFKCQRNYAIGQYILMRFSTYNMTARMNSTDVAIHACRFKALECLSGMFGPNCRQMCSCADNGCDRATGACPHRHCGANSRGPFCTSIDILPNYATIVRRKHYDSRSENTPGQYGTLVAPKSTESYPSWLAIELDGVYFINSFTVTLADESDDPHRAIRMYMDPNISIDNFSIGVRHDWPGVPCVVHKPGRGPVTHHLPCPGLAKTIVLVVLSDSSFLDVSAASIQMWTCVDGMFGAECENHCNCRDALEKCDKGSGSCLSGCARGYKGRGCQQACAADDPDPTCPTKTCHCQGHRLSDCGPVAAICANGCRPGWMGLSCTLPCPSGYFGANCEEECGGCRIQPPNIGGGHAICLPTNGTCPLGCADPSDRTPTCQGRINAPIVSESAIQPKEGDKPTKKILMRNLENPSVQGILGILAVIFGCAMVVILVCCSLKCYWERVARNRQIKEKRVEMIIRRTMSPKVDNKIQGDHQVYHEAYLKRNMLSKLGERSADTRGGKARAQAKAEAIRLMILEMESQRRLNRGAGNNEEEEDIEQDPDQKVALWILKQDFSELIERRKKRLREYTGDILQITESPYRLSEVSLIPDIHKLYDDVEFLGIP